MKIPIYIADLTHTNGGIMALTHPLGTAYVAAYCQEVFKNNFDISLFKFPVDLIKKINKKTPKILAFSNYSWNLELSYEIAKWVKTSNPETVIVFGGPNFPTEVDEQKDFLSQREFIDFYIQSEGEIGFASLVEHLNKFQFNYTALKEKKIAITNTVYLSDKDIYCGNNERIKDVNILPSPYLTGILDEFFDMPLTPMFETTRGCPFSCSFCADGIKIKTKIHRFNAERVKEELYYIGNHVKKTDEIIVTDLNFGMYEQDIETAKVIAELQSKIKWPIIVKGSAGKNKQERIIEVANMLKGSWVIGSAIQSTDKEVLKNINRSNISLEAYQSFLNAMNRLDKEASTYTEIILGLPGDSKERHFNSLRYAVESQVINVKSYQAMLLVGTKMATPESRSIHGLITKFRVMAGGVGLYNHKNVTLKAIEVQELIVGNNNMSFEDYVSSRKMDFILEGFYNNSPYSELFSSFKSLGFSIFDLLLFIHSRPDLYTKKITDIFDIYEKMTRSNLFETYEEARNQSDENFELYRKGELGFNETLECKKMLYFSMKDVLETITMAIKVYLRGKKVITESLENYFTQLQDFVYFKKHDITSYKEEFRRKYDFDFVALNNQNFNFKPRKFSESTKPVNHVFFHKEEQKNHIRNSLKQYENHSGGIARFLYSQNLNMMYRNLKYN